MDSPLDNFAGSLAYALQPDNDYTDFGNHVGIQHRRYTERRIYIDSMFRKPQDETDVAKIAQYRALSEDRRWHECAKQLTNMIQYQVEFIKNVPIFSNLTQADQITTIKSCMFEMAVTRLSRLIDLERDLVLYVDVVMPIKDCVQVGDPRDVALVEEIFDTAKAITRLNLTDTELGLYACVILTLPDYKDTLVNSHLVERMHNLSLGALKQETDMNHPTPEGGVPVLEQLLAITPTLRIAQYRALSEDRRWHECAKQLTNMIQYQVEFIKNVPIFSNLTQADQITTIKSCMFEMAVARLSRLIDLERDLVLYVDVVMPIKDCVQVGDPRDVALVEEIFDTAKAITRLNLTDTELGLYACVILTLPDYKETLVNSHLVERMHNLSLGALKQETDMNHPTPEGGVPVLEQLLAITPTLRNISVKHIEALRRFEAAYPDLDKFPYCLYKDLYCNLPEDYYSRK